MSAEVYLAAGYLVALAAVLGYVLLIALKLARLEAATRELERTAAAPSEAAEGRNAAPLPRDAAPARPAP
ncbi:MAG: hypothetical protein M3322_11790 [Actinomycetota bacterium]|nr:hypothetical protein [Actinomycetota bacterium]